MVLLFRFKSSLALTVKQIFKERQRALAGSRGGADGSLGGRPTVGVDIALEGDSTIEGDVAGVGEAATSMLELV